MFSSKIQYFSTNFVGFHNFSQSLVDIPFFFNVRFGAIYRFESTIYDFAKDALLRNFALT